ncbi:hypothetical protein S23_09340 [Bradyrhizobium cosmicum]|uniref:Uncharacterized protein n=1 Tax=Bradyrhizobium cosmicum TaxID=1404864 RepID=A0AAI8QA49_9BRAD|nr:hypothetical protein S23_09340 [Bradyrhizobium cosmicum]
MAGLVPTIHGALGRTTNADARDKPGHNDLIVRGLASNRRPQDDRSQFAAMKMERPKPVK